jgi:hypothetical protein
LLLWSPDPIEKFARNDPKREFQYRDGRRAGLCVIFRFFPRAEANPEREFDDLVSTIN